MTKVVFDFELTERGLAIRQDGELIGSKALDAPLHLAAGALAVRPCVGIYGPCPKGVSVDVKMATR